MYLLIRKMKNSEIFTEIANKIVSKHDFLHHKQKLNDGKKLKNLFEIKDIPIIYFR